MVFRRKKTFFPINETTLENVVSLPPICGAERLNRESGANPGQFPLL